METEGMWTEYESKWWPLQREDIEAVCNREIIDEYWIAK